MSIVSDYFWMLAGFKVILSFPIQFKAARKRTDAALALANGQRKDDWFGMGVMAVVLVCDRYPFTGWLYQNLHDWFAASFGEGFRLSGWAYLAAAGLFAWLMSRTLERLRILKTIH
ncbi:MAG: hypothetical protein JWP52_4130 [Rhizobacter sp.]|nr:hypothetical protein [Rhizobacter sp.]